MASISTDANGNRTIQFVAKDRKRKSVRLGKMPMKDAKEFKTKIAALNTATITGFSIDGETARWVADLGKVFHEKLASVGLIQPREFHACALAEFVSHYIDSRTDAKPNTRKIWRQTITLLIEFFGADRSMQSLTKADAKDWRLFLIQRGMAEASVRKHCGFAKHFFKQAIDRELIVKNPFADLISASIGNAERQQFISHADIQKVIDVCPCYEWRLIVALSRFGGLRCPSEHLALRWEDIHWDQQRFTVRSPKTERVAGHESRIVPLFPELLPYLEDARDCAAPGQVHVINRYRDLDGNLRSVMTKIVKRAGLIPWPRIFHNLRASRQTELEARFPTHVVCAWIGNSEAVAKKHYLQVRDEDFAKALHIPVQLGSVDGGNESYRVQPAQQETPENAEKLGKSSGVNKVTTGADGNRTHPATFQSPHWV